MGSGPFPTELDDEIGRQLASRGNEFGSTTGRPRRCGWFDAAALKRSIQINGVSGLGVTKLDVLDGMETVQMAIGYKLNGQARDILPVGAEELEGCEPVYEETAGLEGQHRRADALRAAAQGSAGLTSSASRRSAACRSTLISTGPDRDADDRAATSVSKPRIMQDAD